MVGFTPLKCRLPDLEREFNLAPYQIYEPLGMSKQQYSAYANMRRIMSLTTARRFAIFFGIPIEELYIWPS